LRLLDKVGPTAGATPETKEPMVQRVRLTKRRHVDLLLTSSAICPR
jgi:hypothetical protein